MSKMKSLAVVIIVSLGLSVISGTIYGQEVGKIQLSAAPRRGDESFGNRTFVVGALPPAGLVHGTAVSRGECALTLSLSSEPQELTIGQTVAVEVSIKNTAKTPISVPWSAVEPLPTASERLSVQQAAISILIENASGSARLGLPGFLYGPKTLILKPGQWATVRVNILADFDYSQLGRDLASVQRDKPQLRGLLELSDFSLEIKAGRVTQALTPICVPSTSVNAVPVRLKSEDRRR